MRRERGQTEREKRLGKKKNEISPRGTVWHTHLGQDTTTLDSCGPKSWSTDPGQKNEAREKKTANSRRRHVYELKALSFAQMCSMTEPRVRNRSGKRAPQNELFATFSLHRFSRRNLLRARVQLNEGVVRDRRASFGSHGTVKKYDFLFCAPTRHAHEKPTTPLDDPS